MRILSLHPSCTELVFGLGAGNLLVGRTDRCDYPDAAQRVPSIGSDPAQMQSSAAIFDPEIILLGYGQDTLKSAFGPARTMITIAPTSTEEVFSAINDLGDRIEKHVEGDVIVHELRQTLERIKEKCAKFKPVRVYMEQEQLLVPEHLLAELVTLAGGEPYGGDGTLESIKEFNPQFVIVVAKDDEYLHSMAKREGWQELTAFKNERLFHIEEGVLRPTPRLGQGARQLAKILHGVDAS